MDSNRLIKIARNNYPALKKSQVSQMEMVTIRWRDNTEGDY